MLHEIKKLCGSSSQDSKNLRGATAYNYILKPASSGIVILEAAVNELIQFSPFTEMNGAAQMQTKYVKRYWECDRLLFGGDGAADEPFSDYFQGNPWCSLRSRRLKLYQSKFSIFTVDLWSTSSPPSSFRHPSSSSRSTMCRPRYCLRILQKSVKSWMTICESPLH